MQAKPFYPRRPARSVKSVAFLAMTMAMALISALLIVYNLAQATDPNPLSVVSSGQTGTVLLVEHHDPVDHSSLANTKSPPEPDAHSNRSAAE